MTPVQLAMPLHPARRTDPPTSHDAARPNPTRATLIAHVRRILEAHPDGLTDDRSWQLTGRGFARHGSVVKARHATGAVADPDRKGTSLSGSKCAVWVLPKENQ